MKHERTAPVRIGHVSKLDCFVTNARQLPHLFGICRDNDVEVVIAGDS